MPNDGETTDGGQDPQVTAPDAVTDEQAAAAIKTDFTAKQGQQDPPITPQPEASSDEQPPDEPKDEPKGDLPAEQAGEQPKDEPKATVTDLQTKKARHLGIDDDVIATLTPEQAEAIAKASDRQRRRENRAGRQQRKRAAKAEQPQAPDSTSTEADEVEPDETSVDEVAGAPPEHKPLSRLPADATPDEMIDRINQMTGMVEDADQRTSKLAESSEAEAQARQRAEMDEVFQAMTGDAIKEFGGGPIGGLRDGTPERMAREDVFDDALSRLTWYESRDESVTIEHVMREALAYLYPNLKTDPAPPSGDREPHPPEHGVARPSSSSPPLRKPDETEDTQAAREIGEAARLKGIPV